MAFLPTTVKEARQRGWDSVDVVLFTGDAYIDHPAFGAAVIGRLLEAEGYRVAVVPQPNWRDDLRDFRKFGTPRLFFAVTAGAMDSMVNHYTANKRLRSNDAYTPGGAAGFRPDYAVETYTRILKRLYPRTPVVVGGIEASLRRLTHYDYWQDALKPSILVDSGADLLIYGMGERVVQQVAAAMRNGYNAKLLRKLRQVAFLADRTYVDRLEDRLLLHSYEECTADPHAFAENFRRIETESNLMEPHSVLVEPHGRPLRGGQPRQRDALDRRTRPVVRPSLRTGAASALPRQGRHPGVGDDQAFSQHPPRLLRRLRLLHHFGASGQVHPLAVGAVDSRPRCAASRRCPISGVTSPTSAPPRPTCTAWAAATARSAPAAGAPRVCTRASAPTWTTTTGRCSISTPRSAPSKGIKKAFIGSGIRYDLFDGSDYLETVVRHHTSGRLKVAPEHTEERVLALMRKPPFALFERLNDDFRSICRSNRLNYQLIPYFISSHPGCTEQRHAGAGRQGAWAGCISTLEQVQDLTPTPMTLSSVMFYTGENPYTGEKVYVARSQEEKRRQKGYFFRTAESGARPPQGRRTTAPKGVGRDSDTGKRDVRRSAPPHGKSRKR